MKLCLEKGVADVDMKEVAATARVSRATLYRYYPSKKALVYAILRQQVEAYASDYHAERLEFKGFIGAITLPKVLKPWGG